VEERRGAGDADAARGRRIKALPLVPIHNCPRGFRCSHINIYAADEPMASERMPLTRAPAGAIRYVPIQMAAIRRLAKSPNAVVAALATCSKRPLRRSDQ